MYCTSGNYAVGMISVTGIVGYVLSVRDLEKGQNVEGHGLSFETVDLADAYCLAHGYIEVFNSKNYQGVK